MDRPAPASPSVKIAVMGATGSGKTTFISRASGSNLPTELSLESSTAEVQVAGEFNLDGRTVTLIDTPGFDDTTKSDTEILKMISLFLATAYEEGSRLGGVIYVHRISDDRFGGITARNFNMFRKLCGESTLKNVVLVTNMWGEEDSQNVNEAREKELASKFFKSALDKGAQMVRHSNTTESAHEIIRKIMNNHPIILQIQRELVDERKDIIDTTAGEHTNKELKELTRRHQAELRELRNEMKEALRERDEEMRQEMEDVKRSLQETVTKIKRDSDGMAAKEKGMVAKMKKMEQEAEERERALAGYDQNLVAFTGGLQRTPNAPTADRAERYQVIKRLQYRVEIPVYYASNDEKIGTTGMYLCTDRVTNLRKELLKAARPQGIFARRQYVEVVMHGGTEGKFLEDPHAHSDEMMGEVSKLVYWTHADIDRETDRIAPAPRGTFSKAMASLTRRAEYYQHLLSARCVRDEVCNPTSGNSR